jgi:hypothetical protein
VDNGDFTLGLSPTEYWKAGRHGCAAEGRACSEGELGGSEKVFDLR